MLVCEIVNKGSILYDTVRTTLKGKGFKLNENKPVKYRRKGLKYHIECYADREINEITLNLTIS